jgi:hypothetical protein
MVTTKKTGTTEKKTTVKKTVAKTTEVKKTKKVSTASNETWPKITKGSHLTVITYKNGRTELIWDDEALLRDVQNAILKFESTMPVGTRAAAKAKGISRAKKVKSNT